MAPWQWDGNNGDGQHDDNDNGRNDGDVMSIMAMDSTRVKAINSATATRQCGRQDGRMTAM
jgi:hypothetical protein